MIRSAAEKHLGNEVMIPDPDSLKMVEDAKKFYNEEDSNMKQKVDEFLHKNDLLSLLKLPASHSSSSSKEQIHLAIALDRSFKDNYMRLTNYHFASSVLKDFRHKSSQIVMH